MSWYEKILKGKPGDDAASFKLEENANLKWIASQTINNSYQLIEESRTIGSLAFLKNSKRVAAGRVYSLEFIIKNHWLFRNKILIEQTGSLKNFTMLITDFHKSGMIELEEDGMVFWKCYKTLEHEWAYSDSSNRKIIIFKPVTSIYKSGYYVKIKCKDLDERSIAILLLLGMYNLLKVSDETGIASVFI